MIILIIIVAILIALCLCGQFDNDKGNPWKL
jgi:hypothetical protein